MMIISFVDIGVMVEIVVDGGKVVELVELIELDFIVFDIMLL